MKIEFKRGKLTEDDQEYLEENILQFCNEFNIDDNFELTLDFRTTVLEYESDGLFGGFIDMYDGEFAYINVNCFHEYTNSADIDNVLHCVLHEITHIKQFQDGTMEIIDENTLRYNKKEYARAPFNYSVFSRIFELDPALAQDYHTSALPWEKEAYKLPEMFMGRPMYDYK